MITKLVDRVCNTVLDVSTVLDVQLDVQRHWIEVNVRMSYQHD